MVALFPHSEVQGFPPGCLYYLSMWYPKAEMGRRNALFLVAGPIGALLSSRE